MDTEAFKSTLTETKEASLLLHVIDSSDPHKVERSHEVEKVLTDIASKNSNVLDNPIPRVRFREFADHGMRLQLLFWIEKPESRGRTVDAINTEIYEEFSRNNILIPYPTMEVLLPDK